MLSIYPSVIKLIGIIGISLIAIPNQGLADNPFKNIRLSPAFETYLVLTDVNVRAKPLTKSRRIGRLRKNERVSAVGKAEKTEWIAVKKGQKKLGFVYGKALLPVIDGSLIRPIKNNITAKTKSRAKLWPCSYQVRFIGKVKIKNSKQITSDYDMKMTCKYRGKIINFSATMFLTELPYLGDKRPIFQINVDLYNIPRGADDMFSTTLLYQLMKNKIIFDRVNKESLKSREKISDRDVTGLKAVLMNAVEMAHQSWGPIVWSELAKSSEK